MILRIAYTCLIFMISGWIIIISTQDVGQLEEERFVTSCLDRNGGTAGIAAKCQNNNKAVLNSVYHGFKPTSENCSNLTPGSPCCSYDASDCLQLVDNVTEIKGPSHSESGLVLSIKNKALLANDTCDPSAFHEDPTYFNMSYYCIPESRIWTTCTLLAVDMPSETPIYLKDRVFPDASCGCSVEVYSVEPVDLIVLLLGLTNTAKACYETLTLSDGQNNILWNVTITSNFSARTTPYVTRLNTNYLSFTQKQVLPATRQCAEFTLGFRAVERGANISLNCPENKQTDCGQPQETIKGNFTVNRTTYGGIATYTCKLGYHFTSGDSIRTCQRGGQWSGTTPVCTLVDCGPPAPIDHGYAVYNLTTYGSNVTYVCDVGTDVITDAGRRECQQSGDWSGRASECRPKDCGPLQSIANGNVTTNGTLYGSQATYTCNLGYMIGNGSEFRQCRDNGQWTGNPPTCHIRDCGPPAPIDHGYAVYNLTTYGSNMTYVCDVGTDVITDAGRRECQQSGDWSGRASECRPKDCGPPQSIANGTVTTNGTSYDSQATYTCNLGYMIEGGFEPRQCGDNGQWTGHPPTCHIRDCGSPILPEHGEADIPTNTTYNQQVKVRCHEGYTLEGAEIQWCLANGSWSSSGLCNKKDTGPAPWFYYAVLPAGGILIVVVIVVIAAWCLRRKKQSAVYKTAREREVAMTNNI